MKGSDRGQLGHDDADDLGGGGGGGGSALDAYLDGQLGGAERAAFEARLARDPALAGARDAQRQIDGRLRGLFVVPPFIPLPINGNPPSGANGHPANGHPVAPAAAAGKAGGWTALKSAILSTKGLVVGLALLTSLLGVGAWLAFFRPAPPPPPQGLTFAEIFQKQVNTPPDGAIDDARVASHASATIGHPIRLKGRSANLKLVSMSSAHVMSPHTFVLQARYEGQDVLLLADRACEDVPAGHSCGMNQFRREVGGVVLYELTPLDQPMLLNACEVLPAGSVQLIGSPATQGSTTKPSRRAS
jgi:hypothetical protein